MSAMPDSSCDLDSNFRWLRSELQSCKFGEVGLRVIVHAGHVKRIERTIVEKEQPREQQHDPKD